MLARLEIRDFALIANISLEPGRGLVILTGETGAGKSILIDAISVLCGSRAGRDFVRFGQERAIVEAAFTGVAGLVPADLGRDLELIDPETGAENELILSREIYQTGRTVCRVNGRLVPLNLLRELTGYLVDIHGQHDQQSIFRTEIHLQLLDRFGGEPLREKLAIYQQTAGKLRDCEKKLAEYGADPAERARLLDILAFQVREIESARLKAKEDEKLTGQRRIIANAEKIRQSAGEAYALLSGEHDNAVSAVLAEAAGKVESIIAHMPDLEAVIAKFNVIQDLLEEITVDLRRRLEVTETDPEELNRIEERLDLLFRLKKKYGGSLEAIVEFYREARERLDKLQDGEAHYEKLMLEKNEIWRTGLEQADALSSARRRAAGELESKVKKELADLGMKGVSFAVSFEKLDPGDKKLPPNGLDQVSFLLSANPGEPPRPLAKIASGGEASRIMLAIKAILARADQVPTLIFDEIDAGVSGHTADKVAEKLRQLATDRQIFCITHLAQIAAGADRHYLIEKTSRADKTSTGLQILNQEQRAEELARLLSGGSGGKVARQLADQLLAGARKAGS